MLPVKVRIGISVWPTDAQDADALIQHAETALSSADESPEKLRFFVPLLQHRVERRLALEGPLHAALERGELYLRYQPVVSVQSRRLIGVEALLRWRHEQRGEISPAEFVPAAEAAGLMVPLGGWVMQEAFRQARDWRSRGIELKVAVNVAVSQLKHPDFLKIVDEAIAKAEVEPGRVYLGVELTESELMEDAPRAIEILTALKARGFSLSIDDFGTGYSSLAYLTRFPLDVLKIDVAFIRELANDPTSGAIVKAIIALARALKLETVAEGVETPAQFEHLRHYGCDYVQGHLFGRAMLPADIEAIAGRPLPLAGAGRG